MSKTKSKQLNVAIQGWCRARRIDAEPNSINRQRLCKGKVAALFIDSPRLADTQRREKAD